MSPLLLILAVSAVAACSGGASPSTKDAQVQSLVAEVCVDGEGRDSKLYVRNLNNYEWRGRLDFSVDKGGITYTLLSEDRRSRSGKEKPTMWPSESEQPAEPFTEAGDFVWRDPNWGVEYNRGGMVERLRFFSGVTAAKVSITEPYEAEWSADSVPACA